MISVPSLIRDYLREDSHKKNIRIHFPNYERTDICNDQLVINTVQFTESLCSQNKLKFGLCEAPMFECEVVGVGNITGAIIEVSCEIYCPASVTGAVFRTDLQAYVYPIPYGTFTVTEAKRQSDMNHRKITAYGGQAAVDWSIGEPERIKPFLTSTSATTGPTYTPNLGYFLAENGINIIGDECDISVITLDHENVHQQYTLTKYGIEYDRRIDMYGVSIAHFGWGSASVDENAVYFANVKKNPGMSAEYLKGEIYGTFEKYGNIAKNNEWHLTNFPKWAANGRINYSRDDMTFDEHTGSTYFSYTAINNAFYPYIPNFYTPDHGAASYEIITRMVLTVSLNGDVVEQKEYLITDGVPTFTKYQYKAGAASWTQLNLSFESIFNRVAYIGNAKIWNANFGDFDVKEMCTGLAEAIGTLVSMSRDGKAAKFIDIKQLFSLLPSATLYPGQQLYPGATTGGKLFPQYYQSCWYQDQYELQYGRIICKYKDTNNKEAKFILYINGFNEGVAEDLYKTYEIESNAFINYYTWTEQQIQAICETIADNIAGVTYMPVEFTGMGYPYVESGDTFEILTPNNDSIVTIVLNRTLSGEQVLTDTYKSV